MRTHWARILRLAPAFVALACGGSTEGRSDGAPPGTGGSGGIETPAPGPDPWALCADGVCLTAPAIGLTRVDGLWLDDSERVWLAGLTDEKLTIVHADGENWQVVGTPLDQEPPLDGREGAMGPGTIDGSSPDNVWVLGRRSVFHWNGTAWSQNAPGRDDFEGLVVQGVDSVFVQVRQLVWHWDGTEWRRVERPGANISDRLHKGPDGTVWVLAHDSLHQWTGDGWRAQESVEENVLLLGEQSSFHRVRTYDFQDPYDTIVHEGTGRSHDLRPHFWVAASTRLPGEQALFLAGAPGPRAWAS